VARQADGRTLSLRLRLSPEERAELSAMEVHSRKTANEWLRDSIRQSFESLTPAEKKAAKRKR